MMRRWVTFMAITVLLSACAQRPLSMREQGALTGAALGAGTGALIGSATGKTGTGAAIGAGVGLLTGAIVGGAIEANRGEPPYTSAAPTQPPPTAMGQPTHQAGYPSPYQTSYPSPYQSSSPSPYQTANAPSTADPTIGQFVNGTRWRLEVFVDGNPEALEPSSAIRLNPQEARQHNLDLGPHRVIAQAYVETQFGTRMVGKYDRTIQVDPRGTGWTLRFGENDFR